MPRARLAFRSRCNVVRRVFRLFALENSLWKHNELGPVRTLLAEQQGPTVLVSSIFSRSRFIHRQTIGRGFCTPWVLGFDRELAILTCSRFFNPYLSVLTRIGLIILRLVSIGFVQEIAGRSSPSSSYQSPVKGDC